VEGSVKEGAPGHGCVTTSMVHQEWRAIATKYAMEEKKIPGTIKFYGAPAEENYDGKVFMVRAGYFNDVDACLSHHQVTLTQQV